MSRRKAYREAKLPSPKRHRGSFFDNPRLPLFETLYQETWLWLDEDGQLWVGQLSHRYANRLFLGHMWFFSDEDQPVNYFYLSQPEYLEYWVWKQGRQEHREQQRNHWYESDDDELCV